MRIPLWQFALVAVLIAAAWSVGRAQTRAADFEITIDAPRGEVRLVCARGCDWPGAASVTSQTATFNCQMERCQATYTGHGRVTLGMPP